MKRGTFGLVLVTVIAAFLLAGCGCFIQAQKGEAPPPKPPEQRVVAAPEAKQEVPVPPAPPAPPPSAPPPPAAAAPMLQMITFDYDKYNVRPGDAEILKKNLDWFKANPATKARIEGNCDERGTVEYNLALGQKRADSAKNYLTGLGVDGKQLETISYGKERPLDPGHNEAAWAKNRNAQFVPIK
jgi:peptidoglycan-associated lipoprotein